MARPSSTMVRRFSARLQDAWRVEILCRRSAWQQVLDVEGTSGGTSWTGRFVVTTGDECKFSREGEVR